LGIALFIGGRSAIALPYRRCRKSISRRWQVTTQLPAAVRRDRLADHRPLERQLGQIPSLSSMTSTSSFGVSQISLQFDLNRDIDGATRTCRLRSTPRRSAAENLPYPPTYPR